MGHLQALTGPAAALAVLVPLAGCTAGEITRADGSTDIGPWSYSIVDFLRTDGVGGGQVRTTQNPGAETTFSFDPTVSSSETNGPFIQPGEYRVEFIQCTSSLPSRDCIAWFSEGTFQQSFNPSETCLDYYTAKSVPCSLYQFVLCQSPTEYPICSGVTKSGAVTTVPLLPASLYPP